ncbi:hypothetical protein DFH09DRAFT_1285965 [Mycena vulgaris]|nr:hypothetical protein DFH09DRAFT_1285965 [Mycena vulgaris]
MPYLGMDAATPGNLSIRGFAKEEEDVYRGGPNEERTGTVPTYISLMYATVAEPSNDTIEVLRNPLTKRVVTDGQVMSGKMLRSAESSTAATCDEGMSFVDSFEAVTQQWVF